MKSLFLNNSINFLKKYNKYSEEDIEKLLYGLEGLYLTITKMIIIFIASIILNIFKEVIMILVLFNIIRYFGFGVHARKSSECLITSLTLFVLVPYLLLKFTLSKNIMLISGIIEIISFIVFAPADTVKRPFFNARKRMVRKIATTSIGIVYLIISLMIDNYNIAILFSIALLIQSIVICPVTYMLLRQPYNNYKKEKREEV